jgi:glutathione S-transferase
MITLYGRANSANVQKVTWCLAEMGIDYTRIDVGGVFGQVQTPEYQAMNPNSRVPTYVEDDFILWESNAILRYLGQRHRLFMPFLLRNRAIMQQWLDWQQTTLMPAITPVFWGLVRTKPEDRDQKAIDAGITATTAAMVILDNALKDTLYIAGDEISLADFALGIITYRYLELVKDAPALPNVHRWYGLLKTRPAFETHVLNIGLT